MPWNSQCPNAPTLAGYNDNGRLLERPSVKTKKTFGDRAFQVAAPFLWNKLPRSAREATNLESFKTLIKTFLFKE